jgi:hypothetical protein
MSALVFVDTNIILDFYRDRGEGSLDLLKYFDDNAGRIITTEQVEMEYKKNRHRVILESLESHKKPNWGGLLQVPSFLKAAQPTKGIQKAKDNIAQQSKRITDRLTKVLTHPVYHDPVYKTMQRLFKAASEYRLDRSKPIKHRVRRRAAKRFFMGYPPRKSGDTSMGDAINWEWIMECAASFERDVVIVSRDTDYGCQVSKSQWIVNDWLRQEFKERTSASRKLILTSLLSRGFREAGIKPTDREATREEAMVQRLAQEPRSEAPKAQIIDLFEALRRDLGRPRNEDTGATEPPDQ